NSLIEFEDISKHNERGILTRYFGQGSDDLLCDFMKGSMRKDDVIVALSDGVYCSVTNEEIKYILGESENLTQACDEIVALAGERQEYDDRTFAIMVI